MIGLCAKQVKYMILSQTACFPKRCFSTQTLTWHFSTINASQQCTLNSDKVVWPDINLLCLARMSSRMQYDETDSEVNLNNLKETG